MQPRRKRFLAKSQLYSIRCLKNSITSLSEMKIKTFQWFLFTWKIFLTSSKVKNQVKRKAGENLPLEAGGDKPEEEPKLEEKKKTRMQPKQIIKNLLMVES